MQMRGYRFLAISCIVASFAIVCIAAKGNNKHTFKVVPASIDMEPPQILVTFPNGNQDEFVLNHHILEASMKKRCNYLGHIQNSLPSSVAVTGCLKKPGDTIEITMISEHSGIKLFSIDYDGNVEEREIPKDVKQTIEVIDRKDSPKPAGKLGKKKVDASEAENDEKMDNETMAEEKLVAKEHVHYIPPVLNAVIKFGYDRGVMELFHNDENAFDNHFYAMLTHAQAHYSDGSLGFILRLQVSYPHIYKPDAYWTSCNLSVAENEFSKHDLSDITLKVWMVARQREIDCGRAWARRDSVCNRPYFAGHIQALQINEVGDDAYVLAHEMAHCLGMSHCNIFAFPEDRYWYKCRAKEIQKHFSLHEYERGCMDDISGGCEQDPCKNGGKCSETSYDNVNMTVMNEMNKYVKINDSLKSFYCECRAGFSGARCEYSDGQCTGETDCCSTNNKCGIDEGNCKSDDDCKEGLKCGIGNCYNWWRKSWNMGDNCCFNPNTCPSQSIKRFEPKGLDGTCVFPFTRNSVVYNSCAETKKYDGIGWCAWDSEFKEDRWGYCTPSCPNACPSGCRCVSGEGEGSNEVDDEGYCNNWCGNRGSCGHSEAYTSDPKGQIDCRGCTNIETDFVCSGEENCCHPFNKCGENEGECKFDSDCKDNLKCGDKICYQPACYKEDPCGKLEGDCNVLSDCKKGLVCGTNNCAKGIKSKTNTPLTTDDNCCYEPKGYVPLGCWREKSSSATASAIPEHLGDEYDASKVIESCYNRAWKKGYKVFAVRYGKECWSSKDAIETYNKFGSANDCLGGIGGDYSNAVYQITDVEFNQQSIGKDCWDECGKKQGPCSWCGSEGWCCTQASGWTDTSNGCDGTFGGVSFHECALKPKSN